MKLGPPPKRGGLDSTVLEPSDGKPRPTRVYGLWRSLRELWQKRGWTQGGVGDVVGGVVALAGKSW